MQLARRVTAALLVGLGCASCSGPAEPVAATLQIFGGTRGITMSIAQTVRLSPALISANGDTIPMPLGLTTSSSDATKVSVDGLWMTSRGQTPGVLVRGSLLYHGKTFTDSLSVVVSCPAILVIGVAPSAISVAVGETSAAPVVTLVGGCGDALVDIFTWTVADATIATVNQANGAITGIRTGQTTVTVRGAKYGNIGAIAVTVR
jgi:hypothetical protein